MTEGAHASCSFFSEIFPSAQEQQAQLQWGYHWACISYEAHSLTPSWTLCISYGNCVHIWTQRRTWEDYLTFRLELLLTFVHLARSSRLRSQPFWILKISVTLSIVSSLEQSRFRFLFGSFWCKCLAYARVEGHSRTGRNGCGCFWSQHCLLGRATGQPLTLLFHQRWLLMLAELCKIQVCRKCRLMAALSLQSRGRRRKHRWIC